MKLVSSAVAAAIFGLGIQVPLYAQAESAKPAIAGTAESVEATEPQGTPEQEAFLRKIDELNWVHGPASVPVPGNSTLVIPEGFMFINEAETTKFIELTENLGSGDEVMIAPEDLGWAVYMQFDDSGYVKDDEKIDAAELLKAMKENTEASNSVRRERGFPELHTVDWAVPPSYNAQTKRLEWATVLESQGQRSANLFTKVLGRRGYTSVILVVEPENLQATMPAFNSVLEGYSFNAGETYAEWTEGDRVAEFGLAALVLGGAAAIATKKGFWAMLVSSIAAGWKLIVGLLVAGGMWLRSLFKRKAA
jgi:uncharacterized membrane-anchored protein